MNEVALRANDVLRNDVGLRPTMLRYSQTDFPRPFFPRVLKNTENCAIMKSERRWRYEKGDCWHFNSKFVICILWL